MFVRHLILSLTLGTVLAGSADPFASLGPTIQISQADRDQLDQRQVVVKILPAAAQELAVVAAGSINADASTLIASVHRVADLKRSRYVPQIHRLSPQPNFGDFGELTLDDVDLREIGKCRPTDCGLKLSADEIARLQAASGPTGNARAAVDEEFRRVLVQRAERYMTAGQQAGRPEFSALLQNSHYIARHMSELAGHLERFPASPLAGSESFLYWSKERYAWKPMITITHVTILRGNGRTEKPDVIVASRDIFSTRYTSASLTLTLLVHADADPSRRYLVYVNRTWVDGMRALWRPILEHRIKTQARSVFAAVRDRIEGGGFATAVVDAQRR